MINFAKRLAVKHLEPRFYGALWVSSVILTGIVVALAVVDKARFKEEITLLIAVLAMLVATIGWLWSGRKNIMMIRKTNALTLLERISSEEVNEFKKLVYPYIEQYDKFKRDEISSKPQMPELEVQKLLGIYEQVSVAVIHGAVDHEMIMASQSLVFKRIYRGLFHHIERAQERDPNYFINFERLTCNWHKDLERKAAALSDPGGLFAPMRGTDS